MDLSTETLTLEEYRKLSDEELRKLNREEYGEIARREPDDDEEGK